MANVIVIRGIVLCLLPVVACVVVLMWNLRRGDAPPIPLRSMPDGQVRIRVSDKSSSLVAVGVSAADVSATVAVVCGKDCLSAERYDTRNNALRSIARRRDLTEGDVAALMAYVASQKGSLHPTREAALRNDVLNLLRKQKQIPPELFSLLADIVREDKHDVTLVDYAVQHLGALQHDLTESKQISHVHDVLFDAASRIGKPYAGTALYALADSRKRTDADSARIRRLIRESSSLRANPLVRLSAFQLAGQRGYREILPDVRAVLLGDRRDAVTDTVAVGTLGLLGEESDIKIIEAVAVCGESRMSCPCSLAVERIKKRMKK